MTRPARQRLEDGLGDLSGAFADLGTFLPLIVGVLAIRHFDATGILVGFGLFALATALFYRLPMPVQPMKVVVALIIVGALTPGQVMATGLIIGAVLLAFALFGVIERMVRVVPATVIMGVQLGVGMHLAILGIEHVAAAPAYGVGALAVLVAFRFSRLRNYAGIVVVGGATLIAVWLLPDGVVIDDAAARMPSFPWPSLDDFKVAALVAVVPQLALTLSNAVLATAAIAAEYFPEQRERASAQRLAVGTGVFNLALVPFGALPMCHGSGGLVAQYGFGARTWRTPVLFGAACLALGVFFGGGARDILALIPLGAVGALLAVAGFELAAGRRMLAVKPSCRAVVVVTGIGCVVTNIAGGLVIGLLLEAVRSLYVRHRGHRTGTP